MANIEPRFGYEENQGRGVYTIGIYPAHTCPPAHLITLSSRPGALDRVFRVYPFSNLNGMEHLWAGWRSTYIRQASDPDPRGCLFCRLPGEPDGESLIISRGETAYVALNRYPYTTGHVMIAPYQHCAEPGDLAGPQRLELWEQVSRVQEAIQETMAPHGFNLGANLGRVAGAGVPGHFHLHLVPRWDGDANFMTTVGETRVLPEDLADTWGHLRAAFST